MSTGPCGARVRQTRGIAMNILDILILVVLAFSICAGLYKGFLSSLLATLGLVGSWFGAQAVYQRVADIAPDCRVTPLRLFYLPETDDRFDFREYDYIVDAIDTVSGKLLLAQRAQEAGTPIISSMGAGNKLDPTAFEVADIYETAVCPLARIMRKELRKRGVAHLKVVYSREEPMRPLESPSEPPDPERGRRDTPGSVAFVPSVAGLILAGEVIRDLIGAPRK